MATGAALLTASAGQAVGAAEPRASVTAQAATGKIKGTIRKPSGRAIKGLTVHAYPRRGTTSATEPVATATTNARGKYRLVVPRGKYRVLADGYEKLLESQWWPGAATLDDSKKVRVRPNVVVRKISFRLKRLGDEMPPAILPVRAPATPNFSGVPVDPISPYQGQKKCRKEARPGTQSLRQLILDTYGEAVPAYLNRECQPDTSEHYDGRAIDWMVDARDEVQGSWGDRFVNWLTATRDGEEGAIARRLGVMYIVWRGRSWGQYRMHEGWRLYQDCNKRPYRSREYDNGCHRNHIHISLNHDGAEERTTWYTR